MKKNRTLFIRYAVMAVGLIGLVLLGGVFVVYNHRQHLAQDIRIYRYTLAQEGEALRQTYNQLSSISNLLVKNPVIINTLDRHLNGEAATEIASGMVERNLEAIAAIENVSTVFLVSLDGTCLYSSRKEQVGSNYGSRDYIRNTLRTGSGFYAMLDVGSGRTGLYYAQAIKNGSLRIGVAVVEIRPNFFYLHTFTTPFTEEPPQPAESRIGLSTDGNILFNTTDSSLASLQPLPKGFLPENLPPQLAIELLDFPDYDREALFGSGFLRLEDAEETEYYIFHYPIVSRDLSLIHVVSRDWFHRNYHPASSDYSGYLIMLGGMLCVMLGLLWMVNRRHSQALLAAETLKCEAEQRIVEKEKYETIINRNPQGFWLNDFETGRIVEVNQSLCRLLGRDAEQLVGCLPAEFLLNEEGGGLPEERRLKDLCLEGRLRQADGGTAAVLINSSCITVPGSEEKICFSFFSDISERKQEQEQLFLFSQAVEQSTSAIVITDREARIAYVNPAFAELTGWSREEAVGAEPAVLCGGERDTPLSREIWRRISGGGTWKGFLRCQKKDGSLYWEGQTVCPLYDDKGRISYYLAIKNDITQRLELERKFKAQLAKLELMVEHAAIGIAHVVHDRFAWASRAAAEMFGYVNWEEGAELPPIGSLFEEEAAYQTTLAAAQEMFSRDEVFHADQLMRRKDGILFWCSLTGKMIDPGLPDQGAVWLTKDISRQKEEERQLQLAKERAEQASQAKTNFLASVSHELRTPMNAIILGMNGLALDNGLSQEQQEYVSRVKKAADALMLLLDDVLDIANMDPVRKPQLKTVPFELRSVICDAVKMVTHQAEEKKLCLSWSAGAEVPEFVAGDALRLRQILVKLLDNSTKFSGQGKISVAVAAREHGAEQIELTFKVSDEGMGIAPEQLENIFDSFYKIDNSLSRKNSGIGIGLTICRRLCELMGGGIWAESELGKGSVFTFNVLCGKVGEEEAEMLKRIIDPVRPLRILVVDDNEANRFLVKSMLRRDRHQVVEAKDGLEALKLLTEEREPFDVVLMDVQMPVMDGLTVTKIIRACEQEPCCLDNMPLPEELREELCRRLKGGHLPVVALTAHNLKEDRERCLESGMDEYAVKPFQIKDIYNVIFRQIYELIWRQQCCRNNKMISCACAAEQSQTEDAATMDRNGNDNGELVAKVAAHLSEMYQLEPDQVEQMVQISADSISETLGQAKEALATGELAALSAAGHKVKGVLLGIGLNEAAELARQVELKGKTGEAADYGRLLDQLEEGLRPLLALSGG
ncbi:MAG: PAS domain S-box protein [Candidatus Electronema sp. V4]|uniref:PAS domain S-box protein n=1 Tax=Candidatus Electronema sp. V4 TaxID=3454756 RepID=UPI00405585E0